MAVVEAKKLQATVLTLCFIVTESLQDSRQRRDEPLMSNSGETMRQSCGKILLWQACKVSLKPGLKHDVAAELGRSLTLSPGCNQQKTS